MNEKKKRIELLAVSGNCAVVHVGDRLYPALAVQGDSLKILQAVINELAGNLRSGEMEDAEFALLEIQSTVSSMMSFYEETVTAAGFDLPYHK